MVEVNELRKKKIFFIILGRIKQKTKQMLLKGGVATPSTPPLDPPMIRVLVDLLSCIFSSTENPTKEETAKFPC